MVYIPFLDVFRRLSSYRLKLERQQQQNEYHGTKFSFKSLQKATENFSNRLGEDGFASWYKGSLENGTMVEVVVLKESNLEVFQNNCKIMPRISHRNVAEFIGYCAEKKHRMIVTKFAGDYTLGGLLFEPLEDSPKLNWSMRTSICIGVARGVEYLHQDISPAVINRDIKLYNVALDQNLHPKIRDFSIAVQIVDDLSYSCDVVGTLGYIDPEYMIRGMLTMKSDVYSFGVLLLEVITGKRIVKFPDGGYFHLVNWVRELQESGSVQECVDPTLSEFPEDEVVRFINVALFCVQESSSLRPSMYEVLHMLTGAYDYRSWTPTKPQHSDPDEFSGPFYSSFSELGSPADGQYPNEVCCIQNSRDEVQENPAAKEGSLVGTSSNAVSVKMKDQRHEVVCYVQSSEEVSPYSKKGSLVGTSSNAVSVPANWETFDSEPGGFLPSLSSSTTITQKWELFN